jgi:hypothetical protein
MKKVKPKEDKVVIAGEQYEAPEVTTFICNYCSRDLIKLSDSSGNNVSYTVTIVLFHMNQKMNLFDINKS